MLAVQICCAGILYCVYRWGQLIKAGVLIFLCKRELGERRRIKLSWSNVGILIMFHRRAKETKGNRYLCSPRIKEASQDVSYRIAMNNAYPAMESVWMFVLPSWWNWSWLRPNFSRRSFLKIIMLLVFKLTCSNVCILLRCPTSPRAEKNWVFRKKVRTTG